MSFLDPAIHFFWREESLPVLIIVLCLSFLMFYFVKEERKSVTNTLMFFLVCMVGQFISGLVFLLQFATVAGVLLEGFIIGAGIALIRMCGLVIFRMILPRAHLTPPRIAEDIFVIIAYIAWGLMRLRYAGFDLSSIFAMSAVITAVVAFSMQDTLGNILGGVALQLDNSIQIGDWIKVEDLSGRVVDIRWRSTLVETRNGETVVFPNSQLMKNKFMVLGRRIDQPVQWRRWVWFGVDLGVTPTKVVNAVDMAIRQAVIANVAKHPAPNCILMEIDRGCARYALRYWLTNLVEDDPTDAAVRWHVYTALERAGIKLAVEVQNLHIIKENEKYEETLHQRELNQRFKTLKRVELFAQMSDDELHKLSSSLKYKPFANGSVITKQGSPEQHWLFIIIKGEAEVCLEAASGQRRVLDVLHTGDFFGEMSLMTGVPRLASVVARTDIECYRLDKEAFEEIVRARPSIAEEMTHILVERRAALDNVLQSLDEDTKNDTIDRQHSEVLQTVKRFFGV